MAEDLSLAIGLHRSCLTGTLVNRIEQVSTPYETEDNVIKAVRVWASKQGFGIFKESLNPAVKTKGPRRLLMCDKSGKVKSSKSNKPIQRTKKCDCDCVWGVWIEQCEEGWTTVELPKKARELLSQPGATLATIHNHTLMQPVAKVELDTSARNNYVSVPPTKKQRTSSAPAHLPAVTPFWIPFPPIYYAHQQLPPYFNVAQNNTPFTHNHNHNTPFTHNNNNNNSNTPFAHSNSAIPLPVVESNLPTPHVASFGVANYHATPLLTEIFGFTPFGIYCRFCQNHAVGSSERKIKSHLKSKKHGIYSKAVVRSFEIMANKEVERLSRQTNLESYLVGRTEGFACQCEAVFFRKEALVRHCEGSKSCSFDPEDALPELLFETLCGRTVTLLTLHRLVSSLPTAEHFDFTTTEAARVRFGTDRFTSPRLTDIFGFTPFGIYCRVCKDHVGSSEQTIFFHLQSKHPGVFSRKAVKAIKAVADKEVEKLSRQTNLESYLGDHSEGFVCRCEAVYRDKKALARHCREPNSCHFLLHEARPEMLFETVCGRTVSQATLNRLSASSLPTAEHFDSATTEEALVGFGTNGMETETTLTQEVKTCNAGDSDGVADACSKQPLTDREETKLIHTVNTCDSVVETVPGRTEVACSLQPWTDEEIKRLIDTVKTHGECGQWAAIAAMVPDRSEAECRLKWTSTAPGGWTPQDDMLLLAMGKGVWLQVAARVPGRTMMDCLNRWTQLVEVGAVETCDEEKGVTLAADRSDLRRRIKRQRSVSPPIAVVPN